MGLITGDIQLNPEASCLIMTTEILRSMLYNGSEVIRELEWVIFDEVHYINDSERGVVWEEVLIMLPAHVKIVMLSATAPNCLEFAEWVGRIKQRNIFVMGTAKRPVPLQHFIYTGTDGKTRNNRFLVVDEGGNFQMAGYKKAVEARQTKKDSSARGGGRGGRGGARGRGGAGGFHKGAPSEKGMWTALLAHLESEALLPAVLFTFSRRRCDDNAAALSSTNLTTEKEKGEIHAFFTRCISRLKGSDRRLPQVQRMSEQAKRGLAVHHSGILPILKETVELLFQKGYIKVLFATETFAMGVNMPARTVVFDSMEKHDGRQRRALEPGEYTQMAGRAGRRGLDPTGTVILLTKFRDVPESSELVRMMLGKPTKLSSQFRVTYSMLLNLLRVEELRVEEMLGRSFAESAALSSGDSRRQQLALLRGRIDDAQLPNCTTCFQGGILELRQAARDYLVQRSRLWAQLWDHQPLSKAIGAGRVVLLTLPAAGVFNRVALVLKAALGLSGANKTLTLLIPAFPDEKITAPAKAPDGWARDEPVWGEIFATAGPAHLTCPPLTATPLHVLLTLPVPFVSAVTTKTFKLNTAPLLEDFEKRKQPRYRNSSPDRCVVSTVRELVSLGQGWLKGQSELGLLEEGGVSGLGVETGELLARVGSCRSRVEGSWGCKSCLRFSEHLEAVDAVEALKTQHRQIAFLLSPANLRLLPDYEQKLAVLKRLGFVDSGGMVELKGKVACELHQAELLLTELMVENALGPLSVAELASLLSATVSQFKAPSEELPRRLAQLRASVESVRERVGAAESAERVEAEPSSGLEWGLSEVVHEWAEGVPFAQLMELTEAQEGVIVRCIQRLNELAIDVRNGARIVGDPTLADKMEAVSAAIKRDIVFAASLYTTPI